MFPSFSPRFQDSNSVVFAYSSYFSWLGQAIWPLGPHPFAQIHRELGFFQVWCLHCAIFLKNQQPLPMKTVSYTDTCQLHFLPRNLETAPKCCSLQLLDTYSHRAGTKMPRMPAYKVSYAKEGLRGKSLSLPILLRDLYTGVRIDASCI